MDDVYTVTVTLNGDSPDGSAMADVYVFGTLEAARADYEQRRSTWVGRDYIGLWSTEYPNGSPPEELPDHGWIIAYAAPGEETGEGGEFEEDAVGIALRAHNGRSFVLDRIHAAVLANESGADQLEVIYRLLEETGRKVP